MNVVAASSWSSWKCLGSSQLARANRTRQRMMNGKAPAKTLRTARSEKRQMESRREGNPSSMYLQTIRPSIIFVYADIVNRCFKLTKVLHKEQAIEECPDESNVSGVSI